MVTLLEGDAFDRLLFIPPESVQCVITSPPYYGLRNYGVDGQIGLEPTPEEYVAKLVMLFRLVWRALRRDGTVWLNLGDSYASGKGTCHNPGGGKNSLGRKIKEAEAYPLDRGNKSTLTASGLKPKDLIGIPWMVAFALRADGWYLRCDVIWNKTNGMPNSQKDRPSRMHKYMFLLTKSSRYFFDQEAVREPYTKPLDRWGGENLSAKGDSPWDNGTGQQTYRDRNMRPNKDGRNIRSVWSIPTKPYKGAHFATFPPTLVEPCILAGTSERGCCPKCGKPWTRVIVKTGEAPRRWGKGNADGSPYHKQDSYQNIYEKVGWQPACTHDAEPVPCVVLDPFCGAGTTMLVATEHGRDSIGIELNHGYIELIKKRLGAVQMRMEL